VPQTPEQQSMLALLDGAPMRAKLYWLWLLSTGGTRILYEAPGAERGSNGAPSLCHPPPTSIVP
jgi:hypothetical protein